MGKDYKKPNKRGRENPWDETGELRTIFYWVEERGNKDFDDYPECFGEEHLPAQLAEKDAHNLNARYDPDLYQRVIYMFNATAVNAYIALLMDRLKVSSRQTLASRRSSGFDPSQ